MITSANNFLSAKYLVLAVRMKHNGEKILNQQAYLHAVSHLNLVNPEEGGFTGAEMMNQHDHTVESLVAPKCLQLLCCL